MSKSSRKTKRSNKHYKQFPINSLEEGIVALGSLISMVTNNLRKYKEYSKEAESLCNKYIRLQKKAKKEIYIPAREYEDINDKLLYRQREILKVTADQQGDSFSYRNLRKYLVKHKYLERTIKADFNKMLNDFLNLRNWTFHNPQSLLVASKEAAIKRLPKGLAEIVRIEPQLNPLLIVNITHYDLVMLITLVLHTSKRIEQFELILENMKTDYSVMYKRIVPQRLVMINGQVTEDIIYKEVPRISRLTDSGSDMAQISMAIQKSKYDGSNESFNKWVIKKNTD